METLDPRLLLSGYDGQLFSDGGDFLAECNNFHAQINITNSDYQPAGSPLTVAVMQSYTVTLSMNEAIIRDATRLKVLVDALKNKQQVWFGFQGVLNGRDGTQHRTVFRSCVPEGNIDIFNVQPGQILERAWSFRVNETPDLQSLLGG